MRAAHVPRQLALAFVHGESFARDDFLEGPSNAEALALIDQWPDWPSRTVLLTGPEGSGKSHLAAVWAAMSGARLSASDLTEADLPGAISTGALVFEDFDAQRVDERVAFHLLNLVREQGAWLLITARRHPAEAVALPDLRSRLRALPALAVAMPDDGLLRAILVKLFADRQVQADEQLLSYLLARIERSFAAAKDVVGRLDAEALRRHRPVSRALASEVLKHGV